MSHLQVSGRTHNLTYVALATALPGKTKWYPLLLASKGYPLLVAQCQSLSAAPAGAPAVAKVFALWVSCPLLRSPPTLPCLARAELVPVGSAAGGSPHGAVSSAGGGSPHTPATSAGVDTFARPIMPEDPPIWRRWVAVANCCLKPDLRAARRVAKSKPKVQPESMMQPSPV